MSYSVRFGRCSCRGASELAETIACVTMPLTYDVGSFTIGLRTLPGLPVDLSTACGAFRIITQGSCICCCVWYLCSSENLPNILHLYFLARMCFLTVYERHAWKQRAYIPLILCRQLTGNTERGGKGSTSNLEVLFVIRLFYIVIFHY